MRDWANAIRPRLYSPPFAFVHVYIHPIIIRLYHYFIEQMPIGRMRFAPTIFPHHSVDIVVGAYSIGRIHNGRMRFAPTLAHIYILFKSRTGESHSPQFSFILIYIFHHFIHSNGRMRFAPTYLHTYLFRILYGRIAFAP